MKTWTSTTFQSSNCQSHDLGPSNNWTCPFFMAKQLQLFQIRWVLLVSNNLWIKQEILSWICVWAFTGPFQDIYVVLLKAMELFKMAYLGSSSCCKIHLPQSQISGSSSQNFSVICSIHHSAHMVLPLFLLHCRGNVFSMVSSGTIVLMVCSHLTTAPYSCLYPFFHSFFFFLKPEHLRQILVKKFYDSLQTGWTLICLVYNIWIHTNVLFCF